MGTAGQGGGLTGVDDRWEAAYVGTAGSTSGPTAVEVRRPYYHPLAL